MASDINPTPGEEAPDLPPDLRFLKVLVTVLAATMIVGLITIIVLLVIRVPKITSAVTSSGPALPATIALPEGERAEAVTFGAGWVAVVTGDNAILIFDAESGKLRQRVELTAGDEGSE